MSCLDLPEEAGIGEGKRCFCNLDMVVETATKECVTKDAFWGKYKITESERCSKAALINQSPLFLLATALVAYYCFIFQIDLDGLLLLLKPRDEVKINRQDPVSTDKDAPLLFGKEVQMLQGSKSK